MVLAIYPPSAKISSNPEDSPTIPNSTTYPKIAL